MIVNWTSLRTEVASVDGLRATLAGRLRGDDREYGRRGRQRGRRTAEFHTISIGPTICRLAMVKDFR